MGSGRELTPYQKRGLFLWLARAYRCSRCRGCRRPIELREGLSKSFKIACTISNEQVFLRISISRHPCEGMWRAQNQIVPRQQYLRVRYRMCDLMVVVAGRRERERLQTARIQRRDLGQTSESTPGRQTAHCPLPSWVPEERRRPRRRESPVVRQVVPHPEERCVCVWPRQSRARFEPVAPSAKGSESKVSTSAPAV